MILLKKKISRALDCIPYKVRLPKLAALIFDAKNLF